MKITASKRNAVLFAEVSRFARTSHRISPGIVTFRHARAMAPSARTARRASLNLWLMRTWKYSFVLNIIKQISIIEILNMFVFILIHN